MSRFKENTDITETVFKDDLYRLSDLHEKYCKNVMSKIILSRETVKRKNGEGL